MAKIGASKFTWVIRNFCSLISERTETCHYHTFEIDATVCICRLSTAPRENKPDALSLRTVIAYNPSLPPGRRRYVRYRLTVITESQWFRSVLTVLSYVTEGPQRCDSSTMEWRRADTFTLPRYDKDGGFLVNDELKIVAEVDVFEAINYVPKKLENETIPNSKVEVNNGVVSSVLPKEVSGVKERIDVNGFQVLPSHVDSVRSIFERHPDIAVGFRSKNQHLRKACMNSLLCLIDTLCQSLEELSSEDLVQAEVALTYLKDSGFELDWLEKKLDQVKVEKQKGETLLNLKQKCSVLEAELAETVTPMSFDDVV
ncbi:hypothetical protein Bca101_021594 [Brassica carinata]